MFANRFHVMLKSKSFIHSNESYEMELKVIINVDQYSLFGKWK